MLKFLLILTLASAAFAALEEVFGWNELSFAWPSNEAKENAIKSGDYVPENNLPLGLDRWKDKLFVTVPRYFNLERFFIWEKISRFVPP